MDYIRERILSLKAEIGSTSLIAVSKYVADDLVIASYHAGQRDFGESRVQDLQRRAEKFSALGLSEVKWHFLGHLQRNKVKTLLDIPSLSAIHSVDSSKLIDELIKYKNLPDLFLEIKTSGEEEKSGIASRAEMDQALRALPFKGLMTMGAIRTADFEAEAHRSFRELFELKESLVDGGYNLKLSMGMSSDYKIALQYQTDFIRVGSLIFQEY